MSTSSPAMLHAEHLLPPKPEVQIASLMYHGVTRNPASPMVLDAHTFENHVAWLAKNYEIVSPDILVSEPQPGRRARVTLTFDDGFRNNFEFAAPILKRFRVPATFFVSSRHSHQGEYLWFAYFRALEGHFRWKKFLLRGEPQDMSSWHRSKTLLRLGQWLLSLTPHPSAMYQVLREEFPAIEEFVPADRINAEYAGMTAEHIAALASDPLFTIGVHTVDHPLLSRCETPVAVHQIGANAQWLESLTGRPCRWIAYPGGDYSRDTLHLCREMGLVGGFAVAPALDQNSCWEIPRIGVYWDRLSLLRAKLKFAKLVENKVVRFALSKTRSGKPRF